MLLPSLSIPVPSYSVAQPVSGPGWAHELKHDGYRLQIHVRDGRVRLYTINGADWSKRYPLIVESAAHIKGTAILDAEVVWIGWMALPTSTRCIAGSTIRVQRSRLRSADAQWRRSTPQAIS